MKSFKKNVQLFASLLLISIIAACNNNRTSVSKNGLKYRFYTQDEKGKKPKNGDILTFNLVIKSSLDSTLNDTYRTKSPARMQMAPPSFKGGVEEGLGMMSSGDSATFFIPVDSLFKGSQQPLPKGIVKGSDLSMTIKMISIETPAEFQKSKEASAVKQKVTDAKLIADHLAKNKITTYQKTASGVHYITTSAGTGAKVANGDSVTVRYTGKLLNGKVFDANTAAGITFPVGMGAVIPGWDEGLQLFKKGDKGTLFIPSNLAYGADGAGNGAIPANSILIFDIEVVGIKKKK